MSLTTEIRERRKAVSIPKMTREVVRVGKVIDEDTKQIVFGLRRETLNVVQYDVYEHEGQKFWRGACLG